MSLIPIDELIEVWARVHEDHDDDLGWWHPALANLRPTPEAEDDAILDDEEESGEQQGGDS